MVIINLAQTYRWKGNVENCEKILKTKDWSAYSSLFQLCVAALRDDESKFKILLFEIASNKTITISDLCEWPVFRLMRAKDSFNFIVKEAFGEDIKLVTDLFKPKVVDIEPDKTIRALIEYLQKNSLLLENESNSQCEL
jgi:hypothetical protein